MRFFLVQNYRTLVLWVWHYLQRFSSEQENIFSKGLDTLATQGAVILAGDFNRSLHRNNVSDRKFQKFCHTEGLEPVEGTTDIPTYHGYNNTTSRIDYVLIHVDSCLSFGLKHSDIRIVKHICKDDHEHIMSTHDALLFEIDLPSSAPSSSPSKEIIQSSQLRINHLKWEEANLGLYWENLEKLLELNFQTWNNPENIEVLAKTIPQAFIQAASLAVPQKSSRLPTFKVIKSAEWRKAEAAAVKATKKWRLNGCPHEPENEYFINKKQARSELRQAVNKHQAAESRKENNEMMNANFRDPKLFSKLVNKRRLNNQGYTTMLKIEETEFKGDAQVLAGFFEYHNGNATPAPVSSEKDEDMTYYYATINVEAISYIVKQRNWNLPQLSFNQVQDIISRLRANKSPDLLGFSARHVKNGGPVAVHFIMQYLNLSFKCIQYGVPAEELKGAASMIFKGNKKSLIDPKSFRKITVCALLGEIKQMAICDLTFPILRPLKPASQLGFTTGLFVKLANVIVSEKRAYALFHNVIVLHQFLDAVAAFDKCEHPIMLSQLYHAGVHDDQFTYFAKMHANAETQIKWNGLVSTKSIPESIGTRQGGKSAAEEYKLYNNEMVRELELACPETDFMAGHPTSVVALADDCAPTVTDAEPREVLHKMQLLLNIVECHGSQLHMEFGVSKCKLLITARNKKLKEVEHLLFTEPELLTFYGKPVAIVQDPYTHIGVPQAPRQQSKVVAEYRMAKGQDISYLLQQSTKNALLGVSPLSNRKMFVSYFQPSFLYGTDTVNLNKGDLQNIETSYRSVIKHMMAVPDNTPSCSIYLVFGILPAEAQRDLDILGLLGQIAVCPSDLQNITDIISNNLAFYGTDFGGWSGLVRLTARKYSLPDPAEYMKAPWRPDRWRAYCQDKIAIHWDTKLKHDAEPKPSLIFLDIYSLSVTKPAKIWSMAGLDSAEVKKACIVNWMLLGVYRTREVLHKMKIVKSNLCTACSMNAIGSLEHYLLYCEFTSDIRENFLPKFILSNSKITSLIDNEVAVMISILDPESSLLPDEITLNWESSSKIYALSRDYVYNLHRKFEKYYDNTS